MDTRHDTNTPEIDEVMSIIDGAKRAMVIYTACDLELFDLLETTENGRTAADIASSNNWNKDATERLLNACAAFGFIRKDVKEQGGSLYTNLPCGRLLVRSDRSSIWGYPMMVPRFIKNLTNLSNEVRTGDKKDVSFPAQVTVHKGTAPDAEKQSEAKQHQTPAHHGHGHHGGAVRSPAELLNRYQCMDACARPHVDTLVKLVDLSSHRTAVDLGAGSGVVTFALRKAYPEMEVTLFEVTPVINLVKEEFLPRQPGVISEKVTLLAGDFVENEELPRADLYVLSKIVHDWRIDQVHTLFAKINKAVNPGGALMLFEKCLDENKCGPGPAHEWDMAVMSSCAGRLRSGSEYSQLLAEHGFRPTTIKKTQERCNYDVIYAQKV